MGVLRAWVAFSLSVCHAMDCACRQQQATFPSSRPGLALSLFLLLMIFTAIQQPLGTGREWG